MQNYMASRDLARSFSGVFGNLFRRRQAEAVVDPRAVALAEVRAKWRAARAEYARCKAAEDTRGMGEAFVRAKRFAHEAMRLERAL